MKKTMRVLVVDDNQQLAETVATIVKAAGYHVTVVSSAKKALDAYAAQRYDLVISDIVMPGMTGTELAEKLSERENPPFMVLMSGKPELLEKAVGTTPRLAGVLMLNKPFRPSALRSVVLKIAAELAK